MTNYSEVIDNVHNALLVNAVDLFGDHLYSNNGELSRGHRVVEGKKYN